MLPVYQAISFLELANKGGRTEPWVVMIRTRETIKPYILKLFPREQEDRRHSVVNEVIGNYLAREFNLPVPEAALLEADESFRMTLKAPQQIFLDNRDERIKFGCELLTGVNLFSHALDKYAVQKKISIETVFGFDVLIRNRDRNNQKPNLLIGDSSAYLIDHELGFEINQAAIDEVRTGSIDPKFADHHIFLPYLKKAQAVKKAAYFEEFQFCLQNLDIRGLNGYFQQLEGMGFDTNRGVIEEYLVAVKENSNRFVNCLKGITQ